MINEYTTYQLRIKEIRYLDNISKSLVGLAVVILLVSWESLLSLVDKISSVIPLP